MPMYCHKCGRKSSEDAAFCSGCGTALHKDTQIAPDNTQSPDAENQSFDSKRQITCPHCGSPNQQSQHKPLDTAAAALGNVVGGNTGALLFGSLGQGTQMVCHGCGKTWVVGDISDKLRTQDAIVFQKTQEELFGAYNLEPNGLIQLKRLLGAKQIVTMYRMVSSSRGWGVAFGEIISNTFSPYSDPKHRIITIVAMRWVKITHEIYGEDFQVIMDHFAKLSNGIGAMIKDHMAMLK